MEKSNYPQAKLTPKDVEYMRSLRERYGMSYRLIALKFDVCESTARRCVQRLTWKRVP